MSVFVVEFRESVNSSDYRTTTVIDSLIIGDTRTLYNRNKLTQTKNIFQNEVRPVCSSYDKFIYMNFITLL
jgi:hypothetical protein